MADLQTKYVDLLLLHYPECWPQICSGPPEGTWRDRCAVRLLLLLLLVAAGAECCMEFAPAAPVGHGHERQGLKPSPLILFALLQLGGARGAGPRGQRARHRGVQFQRAAAAAAAAGGGGTGQGIASQGAWRGRLLLYCTVGSLPAAAEGMHRGLAH